MRTDRRKEWVTAIITSPELSVVIVLAALGLIFPHLFHRIGGAFRDSESTLAWAIVSVPALLAVATYKLIRRLTHPTNRRQELVEWPEYWRLLVRIKLALWISGLAVMAMLASWFSVHHYSVSLGGWGAVFSVALGGINLFTVALAPLELESILDGADK